MAAVTALALTLPSCSRPSGTDPRMVSEWMHTLYGVIRAERLSPPVASRVAGYASVALYEGLAAVGPLESLGGVLNGLSGLPEADPGLSHDETLTAVAAERTVLDSLLVEALPATRATLAGLADSLRAARLALGVDDPTRDRSEDLGRRVGLAIVAWSRADGFDSTRGRPYKPPVGPGLWVNDAPGNIYAAQNLSGATEFVGLDNPANTLRPGSASDRGLIMNRPKQPGTATLPAVNIAGAAEPYWGELRPFMLTAWNECPIADPPPYSTDTTSTLYREAMVVYEASRTLTPEHRTIALYWADNPGETATPAGHWLAIASQMRSERQLSAEDAARLFLVTAVAQADAFIASWAYKYHYNLLRPRAYLRRLVDSAWEPLIPTPPFPEYPSAHSTQSAAAATVLAGLLGEMAFQDSTGVSIGPEVRRFESFAEAAAEAGQSRIYGGIHYPVANLEGRAVGHCIGAKVLERLPGARTP